MTGLNIGILIATGFSAGIFGTMIGIGGGVVFVPVFLLVFGFTPQQAVASSLVAVFANALSGTISYLRQKRVDIRCGWKFAVATLPGALFGAWLAQYVSGNVLEIIFGFVMIAIAVFTFFRRPPPVTDKSKVHTHTLIDAHGEAFHYSPRIGLGIIISFFVGVVSSLLGIGGGVIHVPALIGLLGFPVHIATATSHFVLAISALGGSVTHLALGNVVILPAIIVGVSAIPGAQIGAILSRKVKSQIITRLLALALVLVGIRLLLKAFGVM